MFGAIITLLAAVMFAAGPFLFPNFQGFAANLFPIPQERPPFQPAGFAFGIWGVIYLWLIVGAVFGLWHRRNDPEWQHMRPALILSMILGAAWLPIAQNDPVVACAMIWAMWVTSIAALFRAPNLDRAMAAWPVGLYAGWLTAAACVATGLNLAGFGILDPELTALVMMACAITLAICIQLILKGAPTYGFAVIWAMYGIFVANDKGNPDVAALALLAMIGIGALALVALARELRGRTM